MNRIIVVVPLALAASGLFVSAAIRPAFADEGFCAAAPEQIRTEAAASTDPSAAQHALKNARTGERLCEAGNEHAARKKFEAAFRALGTPPAEYADLSR